MRYWAAVSWLAGLAVALAGSLLAAAAPEAAQVVTMSPMVVSGFASAGQPLTTAQCEAEYHLACYQAPQLQAAYNLGPLFRRGITGAGQTIAPGTDQILDLTAEQPKPRVPVHRGGPVLELARADRRDDLVLR